VMGKTTTAADRERAARRTIETVTRETTKGGGSSERAHREAADAIRRHERKQSER